MPLKKINDAIEMTKRQKGIEGDLVEDLSYFFYSQLRKKLSSIEHTNFQVLGLGCFEVSNTQLAKLMRRQFHQICKTKNETVKKEMEAKIEEEKIIMRKLIQMSKDKKAFYEQKRKIKANNKKQKQDN